MPKADKAAAASAVEPEVDDEELIAIQSEKAKAEKRPDAQNFSESEAEDAEME